MVNPFKRARTKRASREEAQSSRANIVDIVESDDEDDDEDEEDDDSEESEDVNYEPRGPWGAQQWDAIYNDFMADRSIRVERTVNLNKCPLVCEQLTKRKWLGIGSLVCPCYSDVVKWFYASAIRNGKNSIVATIRGVQVVISPSDIAQVICAPRVANPIYPVDKSIFDSKKGKKLTRKIGRALTDGKQVSFANLAQGLLTEDYRFLHMLVTHNFLPVGRASTTSWDRSVFMYCVMEGFEIDLPQVIFDYIAYFLSFLRKKQDSLPFGTLISELCVRAGVRVDASDPIILKEQEVGVKGFTRRTGSKSGGSSSRGASASGTTDVSWMDQPPALTPMSACANMNDLIGAFSEFKTEQHNVNEYMSRMLKEIYRKKSSDDSQDGHQ